MTGLVAMSVSRVGTAGAIRIRLILELRQIRQTLHQLQHHLLHPRHPDNLSQMGTIQ